MTDATLPLDLSSPATEEVPPLARPRTRWAAIVWGLVFVGLAVAGIWLSAEPDRLDGLATWIRLVDAGAAVGYGLLTLGGFLLVGGLVGLLRRAQIVASRR